MPEHLPAETPLPTTAASPSSSPSPLNVLLEDGPLLAVNKPAGLLTQGVPGGLPTLEQQVKDWIRTRYDKPGNIYLGIPHRLDRPVSGVMVFARNSKAAARFAEMFRERRVRKTYLALVEGRPEPPEGSLSDWLLKKPEQAMTDVVPEGTAAAREARLRYRLLGTTGLRSLVEVELETGRMHQIRVQFASRGWPVVGDATYAKKPAKLASGENEADSRVEWIALHAWRLVLPHPVRYDEVCLTAPVPAGFLAELPPELLAALPH